MTPQDSVDLADIALSPHARHDWDAIERAFAGAAPIELAQAWRPQPQANFAPGNARLGWGDEALWVYAVLRDDDIFNAADAPNQPTWTTGDVFEIFLRPMEQNAYFELHVTPENQTLQLRYPDEDALARSKSWREFLVTRPLFSSYTRVEAGQWRVLAEIPRRSIVEGDSWRGQWTFSLSRYDTTRGQDKPVLSSTSPHPQPRFHRQSEWRRLTIPPPRPI